MSYTPTEWKSGDTITSEKLNKMEQGIAAGGSGGGVLVVTDTSGALNKTWQEISDANETGVVVLHNEEGVVRYLLGVVNNSGTYMVGFCSLDSLTPVTYSAESASGYPQKMPTGD